MGNDSIVQQLTSNLSRKPPAALRHRPGLPAIQRAAFEALEGRRLLSFAPAASYPVDTDPRAIATADFNGDGRSDVATANASRNTVSVLLSNSDGTLQPAQNFATGDGPHSIAVGDVNNDGKNDIITANSGNVSALLGNGNGTFQTAQHVKLPAQYPPDDALSMPREQTPVSVAVGDMNGDGKMDLAVNGHAFFAQVYCGYYSCGYLYQAAEYVNVLLGNGDGTFEISNSYLQPTPSDSIGLADFNGDEKLDVVSGTGPFVRLGNGDGTLQPPLQSAGAGYAPESVIGDIDNDGKLDVVLRGGEGLRIMQGQGDGTFKVANSFAVVPFQTVENDVPVMGQIRSVVAGDVNADGNLDLVVNVQQTTYATYGYYSWYDPSTTDQMKVLLGFGDNTFSLPITTTLRSYPGPATGPNATALADFNGDGRPDAVATEPVACTITMQLNDGNWAAPLSVSVGDATVTESDTGTTNAAFTVTLARASTDPVSVQYATADGTAVSGRDFDAISGTVTFAPGETTKTVSVAVRGDVIDEYDESFHVNLASAAGAVIADGQGVGVIVDNDPPPNIIISDVTAREGRSGSTPFNFTVSLSSPSEKSVSVQYSTADGTAKTAYKDYLATSGSIVFSPGQTSSTIAVTVLGDTKKEKTETFFLNLSGATNGIIKDAQGIGTILNG